MDIGSVEAETDQYLQEVFVNTGHLDQLLNTDSPKSIVVGRTGSGKTALLLRLEHSDRRTVRIEPQALSLQYLSNSTIIPRLDEVGIHLDLFYKLLWQHILVVELLRHHYQLRSEEKQIGFLRQMMQLFTRNDKDKASALEYLTEWGDSFWTEPESRVRQITDQLESKIESRIAAKFPGAEAFVSGGKTESTSISEEVLNEAQKVVNEIQIKRLFDARRIVQDDILNDPQKPYYILIDDLDKDWVDADFAYELIAALIDVAGDFSKMGNINLVIALRENIVEEIRGRRTTRRQQREKQEVLFLRLSWRENQLRELLDARIRKLVRGQYGEEIGLVKLLPENKIGGISAIQFILDRTFLRPRDGISYLNYAIEEAINKEGITWTTLRSVEETYSRSRLRAIEDEWHENYPGLTILFEIIRGVPDAFTVGDFEENRVLVPLQRAHEEDPESIGADLFKLWEGGHAVPEIMERIVTILFKVGAVGVDQKASEQPQYSYQARDLLQVGLTPEARIYIHPSLYRALYIENPVRRV